MNTNPAAAARIDDALPLDHPIAAKLIATVRKARIDRAAHTERHSANNRGHALLTGQEMAYSHALAIVTGMNAIELSAVLLLPTGLLDLYRMNELGDPPK